MDKDSLFPALLGAGFFGCNPSCHVNDTQRFNANQRMRRQRAVMNLVNMENEAKKEQTLLGLLGPQMLMGGNTEVHEADFLFL